MGAQLRAVRRRIATVKSTAKITKAQELIASSRIIKAQQRARAAEPYAQEITAAVEAVVSRSANITHPLTTEPANPARAAVLILTSDRGFCGGFNASVLREAQALNARLRERSIEPVPFVAGRKGIGWHKFRDRAMAAQWSGFSDTPGHANATQITNALLDAFARGGQGRAGGAQDQHGAGGAQDQHGAGGAQDQHGAGGAQDQHNGVDEIYMVYTEFVSMLTQRPVIHRLLPLTITDVPDQPRGPIPIYEFEPSPEQVLDALLPWYVESRVFHALLDSAAAEIAARRRAMKSATDNANELLEQLTRDANKARQAEITQEISEIVGGANALAESIRSK